jgi:hypothetical protein
LSLYAADAPIAGVIKKITKRPPVIHIAAKVFMAFRLLSKLATHNFYQRIEDRRLKSEFGLRPIGPTPRRDVGKIGRQMSCFVFTQSTYSTLSTNQPYIPATRSLFFRIPHSDFRTLLFALCPTLYALLPVAHLL